MKINPIRYLFLGLICSLIAGQAKAKPSPVPLNEQKLSSVELQWEDTPGAYMYEVDIFNSKGKKIKSFVSKSSLFKFNSTSGRLKIRGRIIDSYGNKGLWSEFTDVDVPPEDIKFPEGNEPISSKASNLTNKGKVDLSWPEAFQAKRYSVKIYDKDKKLVLEKTTPHLFEKFELDIGVYQYSITPIGIDGIAGKEVTAPRDIQIGAAQMPMEEFVVQDAEKPLQIKMPERKNFEIMGALEYAYHLSEVWTPVLAYTPFTDDIWSPADGLKPGRYRVGFWMARKGWIDSEKFHYEFVIKPTEAEILASENLN